MGHIGHITVAILGTAVVLIAWLSVMRTVFSPRQRSSRAARWIVWLVAAVIQIPARKVHSSAREWLQDLCSPVSLLLMGALWVISAASGFALLAWGAFGVAFTAHALANFFLLRSSGVGLAAVALLSATLMVASFASHLVRVMEAYGRRERPVAQLATRATRPPDAEVVLADYLRTGSRDHLDSMFAEWSSWMADVQATHLSFPAMVYLRPVSELCWAKAALIVLDCAALTEASAPSWAPPNTRPLLTVGSRCMRHVALRLGAAESPAVVSYEGREEQPFEKTLRLAVRAGLPQEHDEDTTGTAFQRFRLQYAPYAVAIGERLLYHDVRP